MSHHGAPMVCRPGAHAYSLDGVTAALQVGTPCLCGMTRYGELYRLMGGHAHTWCWTDWGGSRSSPPEPWTPDHARCCCGLTYRRWRLRGGTPEGTTRARRVTIEPEETVADRPDLDVDDLARSTQRMLDKLDDEDRAAFNELVRIARRGVLGRLHDTEGLARVIREAWLRSLSCQDVARAIQAWVEGRDSS